MKRELFATRKWKKKKMIIRFKDFVGRSAAGELAYDKDVTTEFEPSSVCLAKMVQNFIEETNKKQSTAKCGRNHYNYFNGNNNDTLNRFSINVKRMGIIPGKLNVHLVPHTHDDVGWLKTVDQYYVGSNNSIQAAPHYIDMIDQTTLGHRFIKQQFNVTPRIGWQIDPFGHSAVQAYLLGAEVGFDSLFYGRIDYQDRAKRKNEKSLEVVWQGSKSLGSSAQIFAGAFPENYEPPSGFYFEVNDDSPIVQDDVNLFDYNVQERVNDFVAAALLQANITRTNHIMWTMGTDFKYQYAQSWFRNMDKLIHYVNQDGRVNALYSTPSIYTDAKYAAKESWPLKTGDFFPSKAGSSTDSLADALAIAQHHDAVSGTEQQHVANDYAKRLSIGYKEVISENVIVQDSSGKEIESQLLPIANASIAIRNYYTAAYVGKSPSVTPKYWLAFTASVPPLGFSTYVISSTKGAGATLLRQTVYKPLGSENNTIEVGPGNLKLIYSGTEGKLIQYIDSGSSIKATVEQSYIYYSGNDGQTGDLQITRVYKEKEHAEVEFMVGPIPIDDGIGKEIVTQITTTVKSNKTFYTDASGRDFLERINLGIFMKDDSTEFSILVDRSVGGSSIVDGQLELLLHRRLLYDDSKGVAEPLNETVCVRDDCKGLTIQGKYYLKINPLGEGAKWRRSFGQEIYSPFLLAFSEQDGEKWTNFQVPTFSAMDPSYNLPDNVAMITLQIGEDKDLSNMASVELKKLFRGRKINRIAEMSLSANQGKEEMLKKRLVWNFEGSNDKQSNALRGGPVDPTKLVVELSPMEIRTFVIEFSKKSTSSRTVEYSEPDSISVGPSRSVSRDQNRESGRRLSAARLIVEPTGISFRLNVT
ncbi:hypothetical protein LguiB_008093 [Lonicera macranthoides]